MNFFKGFNFFPLFLLFYKYYACYSPTPFQTKIHHQNITYINPKILSMSNQTLDSTIPLKDENRKRDFINFIIKKYPKISQKSSNSQNALIFLSKLPNICILLLQPRLESFISLPSNALTNFSTF